LLCCRAQVSSSRRGPLWTSSTQSASACPRKPRSRGASSRTAGSLTCCLPQWSIAGAVLTVPVQIGQALQRSLCNMSNTFHSTRSLRRVPLLERRRPLSADAAAVLLCQLTVSGCMVPRCVQVLRANAQRGTATAAKVAPVVRAATCSTRWCI
jgi:hypothetical protein